VSWGEQQSGEERVEEEFEGFFLGGEGRKFGGERNFGGGGGRCSFGYSL